MTAILVKFLAPLAPYLAAAFLFMAGAAYVGHLRYEVASARMANALLQQTNQANVAAIAAYQLQSVRWNTALDTLGAHTLANGRALNIIDDHIAAQPPAADAPVAPVLAQALIEIGKLQGGAP